MEMMEKVERLREKANVSYEEARDALEQSGGDLLDAIVILERMGKVKAPEQSTFSTEYEEQKEYVRVKDKVEEQEKAAPKMGRGIGQAFRNLIRFIKHTSFVVTKKEDTIFTMPTVVFVLLLIFFWQILVPVMVIALFFGVGYFFEGGEDTEAANNILEKAGGFADDVRNEFTKKDPDEK